VILAGGKQRVAIDGVTQDGEWDRVEALVFSPDGRRLAVCCGNGRDRFVTVDGKRGPSF